jgi:hypothetical protein
VSNWEWFGNAGHLCVGHLCRFHLTTAVNGYLVSTVGEYFPSGAKKMETIGAGDDAFFETMVFSWKQGARCECGCGLPSPDSFSEIYCSRYATPGLANAGHMEACELAAAGFKDDGHD